MGRWTDNDTAIMIMFFIGISAGFFTGKKWEEREHSRKYGDVDKQADVVLVRGEEFRSLVNSGRIKHEDFTYCVLLEDYLSGENRARLIVERNP